MDDKVQGPDDGNQTATQETADIIIGLEKGHEPWFSTGQDGKGKGIYADLMREIAGKEGFSYCFIEVDPVSAKAALEAGTITCYLGTLVPATGEGLGLWQSDVIFRSPICLAVLKDSGITEMTGIKGREIGASKGTPEERYALSLAGKYKAEPVTFPSERDVFKDLDQGLSAAAAADYACVKEKGDGYRVLEVNKNIQNAHRFFALKGDEWTEKLVQGMKYLNDSGKMEEITAAIP